MKSFFVGAKVSCSFHDFPHACPPPPVCCCYLSFFFAECGEGRGRQVRRQCQRLGRRVKIASVVEKPLMQEECINIGATHKGTHVWVKCTGVSCWTRSCILALCCSVGAGRLVVQEAHGHGRRLNKCTFMHACAHAPWLIRFNAAT